jgi:LEA14-like dessication related protein
MKERVLHLLLGAAMASVLFACAGTPMAITAPNVSLRHVEIGKVDFSKQTFVLAFDVRNPNPFPLPINYVSYGVKLGEQRFASGETVASFTVPANSNSEFAISVDLDLLRTAPQLLFTVRDGVNGELPYELNGKLGIDIPLVDRVSFRTSGEIRLNANAIQGRNLHD